jgi:hypothetical protein
VQNSVKKFLEQGPPHEAWLEWTMKMELADRACRNGGGVGHSWRRTNGDGACRGKGGCYVVIQIYIKTANIRRAERGPLPDACAEWIGGIN